MKREMIMPSGRLNTHSSHQCLRMQFTGRGKSKIEKEGGKDEDSMEEFYCDRLRLLMEMNWQRLAR